MKLCKVLFVAVFLALCVGLAFAQDRKPVKQGTITVSVTTDRQPLAGAVVVVIAEQGGAYTLAGDGETDGNGQVKFIAKSGRIYHVTAGMPGYDVQPSVYDLNYTGGAAAFSFVAVKE